MQTVREAAQAVVEALEKAPYLRHEAIDALRAALAQPDPDNSLEALRRMLADAVAELKGAQPEQQSEPITIEAVAEVVRREDGLEIRWLVEGGICALEEGVFLLTSSDAVVGPDGSGNVYAHPPAQPNKEQG